MSGLVIPNDWNGTDYCYLLARVPDSVMWRGVVRGAIYGLSFWYKWDKQTGDQAAAAAMAWEIYDSIRKERIMELQFVVHMSGSQTVSGSGGNHLFELDTAEYNLNGQFNLTTHTWVVPTDGVYLVGAWVQFWEMSGSDNWARVRTRLNDQKFHLSSGNFFQSDEDYVHGTFELPCVLSAGDTVQFFIAHSDGSNRDTAGYERTQRAWAYRIY